MPAATPKKAATNWEQNSASGIAKYRAKIQQMHANFPAEQPAFTSVEDVDLLSLAKSLLPGPKASTSVEDVPLLPVASAPPPEPPQVAPATAPVVEAFILHKEDSGGTPGYITGLRKRLDRFAREHPVLPLTPEPVRDFLRQFRTDNVPTRQDNWKVLSMLYGHLLRELRPDLPNPMLRVEKPRFRKKAGQRLSRQQAKAVIAAISSPLEWALVAAFFGLRLRRAEAERLLPQDIKDDFLVVRGKERTEELPLLPEMRERLLGVTTDGSVLPVRGDAMHYHIAKLIRRAGVSGVRASPHTLRNSAGALWSTFGGDWTANRQLLRHSAKTMTDHYSPLTLDELREKDRQHNPMVCLTRELGLAPGGPASGCPNTSSAPR